MHVDPHAIVEEGPRRRTGSCCPRRRDAQECPITSHQPYPGAIADEPGNCPCATLDYPTPQEAFTQLIVTIP